MAMAGYTVPGIDRSDAEEVIGILDIRMVSLIDLSLTLKHVHWNLVGPGFIAVHEMLDPQVEAVRAMVDETAERIATLGGTPVGTPGALVERRPWGDYELQRGLVEEHLAALDDVYRGIVEDHRAAETALEGLDRVSQDVILGQLRTLEKQQWFIRAHLEDARGRLEHERVAAATGG